MPPSAGADCKRGLLFSPSRAEQSAAPDGLQHPLLRRSRFRQQVSLGVSGLTQISGQGPNDVIHCVMIDVSLQSYQRWNMAILTLEGIVENGQIRLRSIRQPRLPR
jgi:hypothetical protein